MQSHIRALGIVHIVFGLLGVMAGLAAMLFLGGIAGLVGMTEHSSDALVAVPILGTIAVLILCLALVLSIPGILAGFGVLGYRPWARILLIILSVLHLFNFPFGTALGVYGLWALLSPEGTSLFQPRPRYI